MFTTTDVKFDEPDSKTIVAMDQETSAHVKVEVDMPPVSMGSTNVAAMDLEANARVKIEERGEVDLPPVSMVGAFDEIFFPEWSQMSIKEEEDVPSTENTTNITSTTADSATSTTPLGCSGEAVGLKTHISTALGGLLDRALNNLQQSRLSPGVPAHLPTLSQPTPSLPSEVTACRSAPSTTSTRQPRRVYNTELVKQVLRQLDSKPSPSGLALSHVTEGPADAYELHPYSCFYCECRFEQRSTRNTHMVHTHPYATATASASARRPHGRPTLRRGLQPKSNWSMSENQIHTCVVPAQQTVLQEENLYWNADNERLTEDAVYEFTCNSCQLSFSSKYRLIMHVFIHIEGVEPPSHVCRCCGNVYLTAVGLRNHLRMHECDTVRAAGKLYKCYVCDESFANAEYLRAHGEVHSGQKSHKCRICDKSFFTDVRLKMHAVICNGVKLHKCHICSKSFRRADNLKSHVAIHSGVKPHRCHVCSKSFRRAYSLKSHMVMHSGKRPYKCEICGRLFARVGTLKAHVVTHSGVKPYKCDVCGKLFARIHSLKVHASNHSGVKAHR